MSKVTSIKDGEVYEYSIEESHIFIYTQHYDDSDCVFINVPEGKKVELVERETVLGRTVYKVQVNN